MKKNKIDWSKIKSGQRFMAEIDGDLCYGKIEKDSGDIYLCQEVADGSSCSYKHGYKCSWFLDDNVKNLLFLKSFPKKVIQPNPGLRPIKIASNNDYRCSFHKGYITVGCQKITNSVVRKIASKLIDKFS